MSWERQQVNLKTVQGAKGRLISRHTDLMEHREGRQPGDSQKKAVALALWGLELEDMGS